MILSGPEFIPEGPIDQAVIFLHGLGSNGDDLLSLTLYFAPSLPNTAFLAPHAPIITPFAAQGYQWFEYWDRTPMQIKDGMEMARPLLIQFVKNVAKRFQIEHKKIILCGFSQGTMIALHTGLSGEKVVGGIIGFSGALLDPMSISHGNMPLLLIHGLLDDVVPANASESAKSFLESNGYHVNFIKHPNLGHSIDEVGIREAIQFCHHIFNGASS